MEITEMPQWSLPLHSEPEILAVGYSYVGIERVERYMPEPFWQLGLFEGAASLLLKKGDGQWRLNIKPYDLLIIPSDSTRIYTTSRRIGHFYLWFRYPSESTPQEAFELPGVMPGGASIRTMRRDLARCMDLRETDRFESDLLARLILCRLARIARMGEAGDHSREQALRSVQRRIRENSADASLTPESLAEAVGYSRRRLDQIFAEQFGKPLSAYIRERRAQIAEELLRRSSLPIHTIGAQIGIPDPHSFNKFMRRNCGKSPTAIRADGIIVESREDAS